MKQTKQNFKKEQSFRAFRQQWPDFMIPWLINTKQNKTKQKQKQTKQKQ